MALPLSQSHDHAVPQDLSMVAMRIENEFIQHVMGRYGRAVLEVLLDGSADGVHVGFPVDLTLLLDAYPCVGTALLSKPGMWLRVLNHAMQDAQARMLREAEGFAITRQQRRANGNGTHDLSSSSASSSSSLPNLNQNQNEQQQAGPYDELFRELLPESGCALSVKPLVHVRLTHVPCVPEVVLPSLRAMQNSHYDKLVTITGTVVRAGGMKMIEARRKYECKSCTSSFYVYCDVEQKNVMEMPSLCPAIASCKGAKFTELQEGTVCKDYQEIKVQEQVCMCMSMSF
jgi:DNA replicative helicase MCM subunit Mcm2 (Cdc46/Mcm family)